MMIGVPIAKIPLKLGLKGFDENASPFIWSYVIKNNNKGQIFLDRFKNLNN